VDNDEEFISPDIGRASSKDESGHEAWELLDAQSNEASALAGDLKMGSTMESIERLDHASSKMDSTTYHPTMINSNDSWMDNNAKMDASTPQRQFALRGTGEGPHHHDHLEKQREHLAPSVSIPTPVADSPRTTEQKATPTLQQATQSSDWDMKIIERKQIHNDAVSGCVFLQDEKEPNGTILVTTSLDGGLKAHKVTFEAGGAAEDKGPLGFASPFTKFSYNTIMNRNPAAQMPAPSKLTEYRVHSARDPLASLVIASDGNGGSIAFAGGHDDIVLAYGMKSACAVASLYSHRDAVTGLDLITRTALDTDGTIWLENSTHLLFTGSWDATLKIWSTSISSGETVAINREPVAELFDADASIVCVSAQSIPSDGIFIAAGCADGSFCVWNIHTDGVQVLIHKETARRGLGPCSVVKLVVESEKLHLFTASSTGRLVSYSIGDDTLKRDSAVSIGVAVTSMIYTEGVLLAGCSDGGLRLIPVSEASFFGSKPTMWSSINNKESSPGISSLTVTFIEKNGGLRCICCTGAEDGSVLLFELKKVHQPSIKL
jgi:WD40 repeat protein